MTKEPVAASSRSSRRGVLCVLLQVGLLSSQTRLVRIKNVLTEQQDTVEVPMEETLLQVSGLAACSGISRQLVA